MEKKNKKILFIVVGIILLIALGLGCYFAFRPARPEEVKKENKQPTSEKITISFETDSDEKIDDIIIESGNKIDLPEIKKKGYTFDGWYLEDEKVSEDTTFDKDTTLKAKWIEETKEKTFTIKFDSKGGSKVSDLKVKCDSSLKLPKKPTRDGYTFVTWEDNNGKSILDGAKLSCENITLYAVWEKISTRKEEYTCAEGGNLDGTKCLKEGKIHERCPDETNEFEGKCVTISYNARKDYSYSCDKSHITYMSYAGYTDGVVVTAGNKTCAYYKTSDTTQSNCQSHGFKWINNACYVKTDSTTLKKSCSHLTNYVQIETPSSVRPGATLNGGCYPVKAKEKYCDNEYTLTDGKCIKTYNAIKVIYD